MANLAARVVTHYVFECIIVFLLFLDFVLVGIPWSVPYVKWLSLAVISAFTCEAVLKLTGLGVKEYFGNPWNTFDIAINIFAHVCFWLAPGLSCLRAFRSVRVFRMFARIAAVRHMVIIAFKMLENFRKEFTWRGRGGLALLLILLLFMYIFGAALTAEVGLDHPEMVGDLPKAMWMTLLIPLFDGEGLAFIRWCADERKYHVLLLCVMNFVLIGFGILNGLIGVFGNAFCIDDEEFDEDVDESEQEDLPPDAHDTTAESRCKELEASKVFPTNEQEDQPEQRSNKTKCQKSTSKLFGSAKAANKYASERDTEAKLRAKLRGINEITAEFEAASKTGDALTMIDAINAGMQALAEFPPL